MTDGVERVMESPGDLRMSLAAAMTLGFKRGLFYRNARLYCINLLLTYPDGCLARCAYCGLSSRRPGAYNGKSFIRVTWPTYPLAEIVGRLVERKDRVKRVCISMVTRKRAVGHTIEVCRRLRSAVDIPVSLLIAPTVLNRQDLIDFKVAGADMIGVAIDLATPELFDRYRGRGVNGPHRWDRYWQCLADAIEIFGEWNAGAHFMVGMGETEEEMAGAIQRVRDMGGRTHLFSFFPEPDSAMGEVPPPPMDQYRRIQVARHLIDRRSSTAGRFSYTPEGKILGYGLDQKALNEIIDSGEPFRTSGCEGYDGEVACNRPYANSRPGPDMRNYPFRPTPEDVQRIRQQMVVTFLGTRKTIG
ncbi:MAG: lipoyl synthase, partial [Thermodesulfobacteriota bacterium]|nr:lipoyl synthase [Thermodesulfobacteriota bacterium]